MSKTAEVLEAGAEQLREWAEWAKTDCFETFEEWFLGIKLADDEKPRVIITPPPKKAAADGLTAGKIRSMLGDYRSSIYCQDSVFDLGMTDVGIERDMFADRLKIVCRKCRSLLAIQPYGAERATLIGLIRPWYSKHGPYCGRVIVERANMTLVYV